MFFSNLCSETITFNFLKTNNLCNCHAVMSLWIIRNHTRIIKTKIFFYKLLIKIFYKVNSVYALRELVKYCGFFKERGVFTSWLTTLLGNGYTDLYGITKLLVYYAKNIITNILRYGFTNYVLYNSLKFQVGCTRSWQFYVHLRGVSIWRRYPSHIKSIIIPWKPLLCSIYVIPVKNDTVIYVGYGSRKFQ